MRGPLRAWRDSNPQPSDPSPAAIYRHWRIGFLGWFITQVAAAQNAPIVGIGSITRARSGQPGSCHLELGPGTNGLATVTRLWGSHDDGARNQ